MGFEHFILSRASACRVRNLAFNCQGLMAFASLSMVHSVQNTGEWWKIQRFFNLLGRPHQLAPYADV
jgi:hypothetical protein